MYIVKLVTEDERVLLRGEDSSPVRASMLAKDLMGRLHKLPGAKIVIELVKEEKGQNHD